ncbi:hypothetical protein ACNI3K_07825 [Demequina sp. SO4-13]|uniref:hypothetical protein n=1 Tax=Demequina sp. SO4-13 TaxID=3401027 RepID=UPI003AF768AA
MAGPLVYAYPNPLVPAAYDVIWMLTSLALLAVVVLAIVLIVRRSRRRDAELTALRLDVDDLKSRDGL